MPNSLRYDLCKTALGVSEEVAANGLKGNKKKRAKRLDEDFNVSRPEIITMRAKLQVSSSIAGSKTHVTTRCPQNRRCSSSSNGQPTNVGQNITKDTGETRCAHGEDRMSELIACYARLDDGRRCSDSGSYTYARV